MHHPLSNVVLSLEQRFGRFAFPGLIRILAVFQFAVLMISMLRPGYAEALTFNLDKILSGEVWRLFSFIFLPLAGNLIFGLIAMLFLWMLSDGLEQAWGSFRVNLYVLGTYLGLLASAFFLPAGYSGAYSFLLFTSILFAFASLYPDYTILLFFVIPIKMKWVAFIDIAFILLFIVDGGPSAALVAVLSQISFLLTFTPPFIFYLKNRKEVAERRERYQSKQNSPDDAFHVCAKCGATEHDDPDLEFRVEDDGEEYCENCLNSEAKV